MIWIDIVILALVVGGGVLGWRMGVLHWLFMLVGTVGGVIIASRLYESMQGMVPGLESEGQREIAAFVLIFLIVLIGAVVALRVSKVAMGLLMIRWVDRAAGLAVGLAVGIICAAAAVSLAGVVSSDSINAAVQESEFAKALLEATTFIRVLLPENFDSLDSLFNGSGSTA